MGAATPGGQCMPLWTLAQVALVPTTTSSDFARLIPTYSSSSSLSQSTPAQAPQDDHRSFKTLEPADGVDQDCPFTTHALLEPPRRFRQGQATQFGIEVGLARRIRDENGDVARGDAFSGDQPDDPRVYPSRLRRPARRTVELHLRTLVVGRGNRHAPVAQVRRRVDLRRVPAVGRQRKRLPLDRERAGARIDVLIVVVEDVQGTAVAVRQEELQWNPELLPEVLSFVADDRLVPLRQDIERVRERGWVAARRTGSGPGR